MDVEPIQPAVVEPHIAVDHCQFAYAQNPIATETSPLACELCPIAVE